MGMKNTASLYDRTFFTCCEYAVHYGWASPFLFSAWVYLYLFYVFLMFSLLLIKRVNSNNNYNKRSNNKSKQNKWLLLQDSRLNKSLLRLGLGLGLELGLAFGSDKCVSARLPPALQKGIRHAVGMGIVSFGVTTTTTTTKLATIKGTVALWLWLWHVRNQLGQLLPAAPSWVPFQVFGQRSRNQLNNGVLFFQAW